MEQLGILTLLVVTSIHTCGRIAQNSACTCAHIRTHTNEHVSLVLSERGLWVFRASVHGDNCTCHLYSYRLRLWGTLDKGYTGLFCTSFATSCEFVIFSKQKVKKKSHPWPSTALSIKHKSCTKGTGLAQPGPLASSGPWPPLLSVSGAPSALLLWGLALAVSFISASFAPILCFQEHCE